MYRQDTVDKLYLTALDLFLRNGFENVSVQDICEAVGITKPTFYKFVPSKEALLEKFYDDDIEQSHPWWADVKDGNYWQAIMKGLDLHFEHFTKYGLDLYTALHVSNLKDRKSSLELNPRFFARLIDLVAKAQEAGQILCWEDPVEVARILCCMRAGHGLYWCLSRDEDPAMKDFQREMASAVQVPEQYFREAHYED